MRKDYYIDDRGYYRYRGSDKLVHRLIAEKYVVGRPLYPGEVVHHINENKLDNRPQNLEVMTWDEHNALHQRQWGGRPLWDLVKIILFVVTLPFSLIVLFIWWLMKKD